MQSSACRISCAVQRTDGPCADMQKQFEKAVKLDPGNSVYKKGLDMTEKAPSLYDEIQKQINHGARPAAEAGTSPWFKVLGYATVILGILVVSTVVGKQSQQAQQGQQTSR